MCGRISPKSDIKLDGFLNLKNKSNFLAFKNKMDLNA
jgi:hypothetical protein